jgi:hypothetical protein
MFKLDMVYICESIPADESAILTVEVHVMD